MMGLIKLIIIIVIILGCILLSFKVGYDSGVEDVIEVSGEICIEKCSLHCQEAIDESAEKIFLRCLAKWNITIEESEDPELLGGKVCREMVYKIPYD